MQELEHSTSNRSPDAVAQHVADDLAIFTLPACPLSQSAAQRFPMRTRGNPALNQRAFLPGHGCML